jgi:predicted ribosome quality control (RQC) complex YloA/Tae2 family protein
MTKDYKHQPDCWIYNIDEDWTVYAGKNAQDNELLSLHFAKANEYWFHVKGHAGSHVILRNNNDDATEPDKELLQKAAAIAAWHSKARMQGIARVNYCKARNVGKERNSPTGTVTVKNTKIIKVKAQNSF